jgi:phosphoglycerate kinase
MKTILDVADLKNKKVLLRVDFDVPLRRGSGQAVGIEEDFRIKKQKEMLDWLIKRGAKVLMVAHLRLDSDSFADLIPQLHILSGYEIGFIKGIEDIEEYFDHYPGVGLLENIRRFDGEKENNKGFAEKLSKGFDIYVNNDFAVCHRAHSSVSAITGFLPSFAGLLVQEEITQLQKAIDAPRMGKVVIIGGAKAETKVPVVKNFISKAELILLGGVVANDVLKERGQDMGSSIVDENSKELLAGLDINDPKLLVPEDFVVFDNKILDIGEKTIKKYIDAISGASVVIWNGPMGLFENPSFAMGTNGLAKAIVNSSAYKIMGGGDTISAVDKLGFLDKFDLVSTGGGAMLAFLAGEKLPGLKALGYYE